jgi:hypothetical protein
MALQDTADRLGGDAVDNPLAFEWPGQFEAIPLGEGTPELLRSLAGHLDQMHCYLGGKKWLTTPARFVGQPRNPLVEKALEPCADDSPPHRQAPSHLREGQAIGAQEDDLPALGQPCLDGRRALLVFKLRLFSW